MLIDTLDMEAPVDFIDGEKYRKLFKKMSGHLAAIIRLWGEEESESAHGLKKVVPIWEKSNLTLEEASDYFNIGINRLRRMSDDENCPYVLFVGSKRLIKREIFESYLAKEYSI